MGFVDYNTLGNFNAEVNSSLPAFAAENLYSLPTKQFGAATIDADNVSNYDPTHWSRFTVDTSTNTDNDAGGIVTRSDKGFHFTNDADSGKVLGIKLSDARNRSLSETFSLNPGDSLYRDGAHSTVVYVPAGGSEAVDGVITVIPWMSGWQSTDANVEKKFSNVGTEGWSNRHDYLVDVLPTADYVIPNGGTNGTNGTNGDNGNNGNGGNGNGETEEGTNWMLYGGAFALLAVGGFMAVNMMKKKKSKK